MVSSMLTRPPLLNSVLFLNHRILGTGIPEAEQMNWALPLVKLVTSSGFMTNNEGSEMGEKKTKTKLSSFKCDIKMAGSLSAVVYYHILSYVNFCIKGIAIVQSNYYIP